MVPAIFVFLTDEFGDVLFCRIDTSWGRNFRLMFGVCGLLLLRGGGLVGVEVSCTFDV